MPVGQAAAPQLFGFHYGTGCLPPMREHEVQSASHTPGNMAVHVDHAEDGRDQGQAAQMAGGSVNPSYILLVQYLSNRSL